MPSPTVLLSEKPDVASRIALALADPGTLARKTDNGVAYYEFSRGGKRYVCLSAVGHLFGLVPADNERNARKWSYPIFDFAWVPTYTREGSAWTEKYHRVLERFARTHPDVIACTDYDNEGEVIAFEILKNVFGRVDAKRMLFSTLTKEDVVKAFDGVLPSLVKGAYESGIARHEIDAIFGFNVTRALTKSLMTATKAYRILSAGRVQSPTLTLLMEREVEIRKFVPTLYWQLLLHVEIGEKEYVAVYEEDRLWKKEEADKIYGVCKNERGALVAKVEKVQYRHAPPHPFNTTTLQTESYNKFRFSPTQTVDLGERLYTHGYCVDGNTLIPLADGAVRTIANLAEGANRRRILGIDGKFRATESRIIKVWKIPFFGVPVSIRLQTNDEVIVTPDHRLLSIREGVPVWLPASEINRGDFLAIPRRLRVRRRMSPATIVELLSLFSQEEKRQVRVRFSRRLLLKLKGRIRKKYGSLAEFGREFDYKYVTFHAMFSFNPITWEIIEALLRNGILNKDDLKKDNPRYSWTRSAGVKLPFMMTEELFYFLGIVAADGHCGETEIEFAPVSKLGAAVKRAAKGFALNSWTSVSHVGLSSRLIVKICNYLGIPSGKKAYLIDIPDFVSTQPDRLVWAYVSGFFDGDGSAHLKKTGSHKSSSPRIAFTSRSSTFLRKLKLLLLTYSIRSYLYKDDLVLYSDDLKTALAHFSPMVRIRKRDLDAVLSGYSPNKPFRHCSDLIPIYPPRLRSLLARKGFTWWTFKKKYGIDLSSQLGGKRIQLPALERLSDVIKDADLSALASDVAWSAVKSVKRADRQPFVYDFTTSTTNFVGNSILLHNCSYPRSGSEKLPTSLDYKKMISVLSTIPAYSNFASFLLRKDVLEPNEGEKTDPAHYSIVSTTEMPSPELRLPVGQQKLYDLICRRTLATFGDDAVREKNSIVFDVKGYKFVLAAKHTLVLGWMEAYKPYLGLEEEEPPPLKEGDRVKILRLEMFGKQTDPPGRYSQASVIKALEDKSLGTRATRHETLQTLYDRKYIIGKSIQVTPLGEAVYNALRDGVPELLSEDLTRVMEDDLDKVYDGRKARAEVVEETKNALIPILQEFKKNETLIGNDLVKGLFSNSIGDCVVCGSGKLIVIKSKTSSKRFVGCSNYTLTGCKASSPLPQKGTVKSTGAKCTHCSWPIVQIKPRGKKFLWRFCVNINCPGRAITRMTDNTSKCVAMSSRASNGDL